MKRWGGMAREWAEANVEPWMVLVGLVVAAWLVLHNPIPWAISLVESGSVWPPLIISILLGLPAFLAGAASDPGDDDEPRQRPFPWLH